MMTMLSKAISEDDYFKSIFVIIGALALHFVVSLKYASSFAINLYRLIGTVPPHILVYISTAFPIVLALIIAVSSIKKYTNPILKYFSASNEIISIMPYVNIIYVGVSSLHIDQGNITLHTPPLIFLGVYLLASLVFAAILSGSRLVLVEMYRISGSRKERLSVSSEELEVELGSKEKLLINVHTRVGREGNIEVTPRTMDAWTIRKKTGPGLAEFHLAVKTPLEDNISVFQDDEKLLEFRVSSKVPSLETKIIFEVIVPSAGGKSVRRYEIVKRSVEPLSKLLNEIRQYIPAGYTISRISKRVRNGFRIVKNLDEEMPSPETENLYVVELAAGPAGTIRASRKQVAWVPAGRSLEKRIAEIYRQYEELRDDLW